LPHVRTALRIRFDAGPPAHYEQSVVPTRPLLLAAMAAMCLTGCEFDEIMADSPEPQIIYVREPSRPVYFDPYYNQPKIYRQQPQYFYESTSKKTKGNKVTKTTTVRNQYGQTVYKEKNTHNKKKKK
jgi:hypothetical protein